MRSGMLTPGGRKAAPQGWRRPNIV